MVSSYILKISLLPVCVIVTAGPVPTFVIFNCVVVWFSTTVSITVVIPSIVRLPLIRALPLTSNLNSELGVIVPIPTLLRLPSTNSALEATVKFFIIVAFSPVKFPLLSITCPYEPVL